jgi:membrane protein implicated in regulation of membrane protease activity
MTFLIIMAVGLVGLLLMALPGMQRHGHVGGAARIAPHVHGGVHAGHASAHAPHAGASAPRSAPGVMKGAAGAAQNAEAQAGFEIARLIPSPRAIFSMMTLFGAFAYGLFETLHVWQLAAVLALVPAVGIEYFAVRPLWNMMFQFQGRPTSPIEALVTCEAKAVTPFRNGRGVVAVERDGRVVQFSARLQDKHAGMPVKVGDTLCVEEVDPANERMLVSLK